MLASEPNWVEWATLVVLVVATILIPLFISRQTRLAQINNTILESELSEMRAAKTITRQTMIDSYKLLNNLITEMIKSTSEVRACLDKPNDQSSTEALVSSFCRRLRYMSSKIARALFGAITALVLSAGHGAAQDIIEGS